MRNRRTDGRTDGRTDWTEFIGPLFGGPKLHLDLVLTRVGIFIKFSINGEFIKKAVTVGLYKFIRK